jgi:hypothetical protein
MNTPSWQGASQHIASSRITIAAVSAIITVGENRPALMGEHLPMTFRADNAMRGIGARPTDDEIGVADVLHDASWIKRGRAAVLLGFARVPPA